MSGAPGQKSFSTQPFAAVQANETALGANFSIWAGLSTVPSHSSLASSIINAILPKIHKVTAANLIECVFIDSMAPLPDGKTVVGTFSCFNEATGVEYYSTMATINMTNPTLVPAGSFPPTKRVVPQLFYVSDDLYTRKINIQQHK